MARQTDSQAVSKIGAGLIMTYAYQYGMLGGSKLPKNPWLYLLGVLVMAILMAFIFKGCAEGTEVLTASWYSVSSLHKDGQWKITKGVMANGEKFSNKENTCATRLYTLGTFLKIYNIRNGRTITVRVTDRIAKRFAKTRIDLSKRAFSQLLMAGETLDKGLIKVRVEKLQQALSQEE